MKSDRLMASAAGKGPLEIQLVERAAVQKVL